MQMTTTSEQVYRFGPLGWCVVDSVGRPRPHADHPPVQCSSPGTPYNITGVLYNATSYPYIPAAYVRQTGQLVLIPVSAGE
jgi:hypothetical protein